MISSETTQILYETPHNSPDFCDFRVQFLSSIFNFFRNISKYLMLQAPKSHF